MVLLASAGCGFESVDGAQDGGVGDLEADGSVSSPTDGDARDGDARDGDVPDLVSGIDQMVPDPCQRPMLLIAVENLAGQATNGGRIVRLSLGAGAAPKSCPTLSGGGQLSPRPLAVAMTASGLVAAATTNGLSVLDPGTDSVRWSMPLPTAKAQVPIDVFPLDQPGGPPLIAVAAGDGSGDIGELVLFGEAAATPSRKSLDGVQLPLGTGISGMTRSPLDPTHLFAAEPGSPMAAAWDVSPWTGSKSVYRLGVTYLKTLYATSGRVAWQNDFDTSALYYANGAAFPTEKPLGPINCVGTCDTIVHAVPDPTSLTAFFLLCEGAQPNTRHIARLNGGNCDDVFEGAQLDANSRLSRLGIAE